MTTSQRLHQRRGAAFQAHQNEDRDLPPKNDSKVPMSSVSKVR
jgi:hypothetical protein